MKVTPELGEVLPAKSKIAPPRNGNASRSNSKYRHLGYSVTRLRKWLGVHVGMDLAVITAKYVKLEWIPVKYRQGHYLFEWAASVQKNTFIDPDGRVRYIDDFCSMSNSEPLIEDSPSTFFVHPVSNILYRVPEKPRVDYFARGKAQVAKRFRYLGPYHQLYKIKGIWFELQASVVHGLTIGGIGQHTGVSIDLLNFPTTSPTPSGYVKKRPDDMLLESGATYMTPGKFNRGGRLQLVKMTLKRQLSSKELKNYGLKNYGLKNDTMHS